MENRDNARDPWVEAQIAALDSEGEGQWKPNAGAALVRHGARVRRERFLRRSLWSLASAAAIVIAVLILQAPTACATPRGCAVHWWNALFTISASQPDSEIPAYKIIGRRDAPVTIEVFTDYECPACAALYRDTMPQLMRDFVDTGKVRIIHRDFPLNIHAYSNLAARYANAAGEAGYYQAAVNRLFETQAQWSKTGDIAAALADVVPTAVLQSVAADRDRTVANDVAQGRRDQLSQTPTLVIVWKGSRQPVAPVPDYERLKAYLNEVLR
ncbi:MAG TPA: thioredoxin domain-containing protein [Candidatus Limnocylindrales bacterium]|nr:thioredoxin domain-containing protein [Candidatus Limnocylindrales bacterium]